MTVAAVLLFLTVHQTGTTLLWISGRRHRRHRSELVHNLRVHRVLPKRVAARVASTLPAVSITAGATAYAAPPLTALLAPERWIDAQTVVGGGVTVFYLAFLGYLSALSIRDPQASCGCLATPGERTSHSLVRAAVIAATTATTMVHAFTGKLTGIAGWPLLIILTALIGAAAGYAFAGPAPAHPATISPERRKELI